MDVPPYCSLGRWTGIPVILPLSCYGGRNSHGVRTGVRTIEEWKAIKRMLDCEFGCGSLDDLTGSRGKDSLEIDVRASEVAFHPNAP